MATKKPRKRGRPLNSGQQHEAVAHFKLSDELEAEIVAYKNDTGIASRGEVYRQLLRLGLDVAKEMRISKEFARRPF